LKLFHESKVNNDVKNIVKIEYMICPEYVGFRCQVPSQYEQKTFFILLYAKAIYFKTPKVNLNRFQHPKKEFDTAVAVVDCLEL